MKPESLDAGAPLKDKDGFDIDVTRDTPLREPYVETSANPQARRPMKGRSGKPMPKGLVIKGRGLTTGYKTKLKKKTAGRKRVRVKR